MAAPGHQFTLDNARQFEEFKQPLIERIRSQSLLTHNHNNQSAQAKNNGNAALSNKIVTNISTVEMRTHKNRNHHGHNTEATVS